MTTKIDEDAYAQQLIARIKASGRTASDNVLIEKRAAEGGTSTLIATLKAIDTELKTAAVDRASVEKKIGTAFGVAVDFARILKEASISALTTSSAYWATFLASLKK